eukprot:774968-Amphidinium_carterae.2
MKVLGGNSVDHSRFQSVHSGLHLLAGSRACEVLRDYHGSAYMPGKSSSSSERKSYKEEVAALLAGEKRGKEHQLHRLHTLLNLQALGNMLAVGTGNRVTLKDFVAKHPLRPLHRGESRVFVSCSELPPALSMRGEECRAFIRKEGKEGMSLEIMRTQKRGEIYQPELALHMLVDRGAGLWTGHFGLFSHMCLNGTARFDVPHKEWDDVRLCASRCGLGGFFDALLVAMNVFTGPFGGSAWYSEVQACVKRYSQLQSFEDAFSLAWYPKLFVEQKRPSAHVGTKSSHTGGLV